MNVQWADQPIDVFMREVNTPANAEHARERVDCRASAADAFIRVIAG